jgi:transcription termination factor Rho
MRDRTDRPDRDRQDRGPHATATSTGPARCATAAPRRPRRRRARTTRRAAAGRFRERGPWPRPQPGPLRRRRRRAVVTDDDVLVPVGGILDVLDQYGFIRTSVTSTGPSDVYVSLQQVRRYGLRPRRRRSPAPSGSRARGERKDKYNALVRLDTVNGLEPEQARQAPGVHQADPALPRRSVCGWRPSRTS